MRLLLNSRMASGLGIEPRFSDSKSDVLPVRRPRKSDPTTATPCDWLGDLDSNQDLQTQNLTSYQLDDPQNSKPPAGLNLLGACFQKADHSLPSGHEGGLHGLLLVFVHSGRQNTRLLQMCQAGDTENLQQESVTLRCGLTPRWSQRRLRLEFMDGLSYTTIIELTEPLARRRGSALDR